MLNGLNLSCFCAAGPRFIHWFACFREIIDYPYMDEEEKLLGLWIANKCADNLSFSCSFTYEQMSQALNKSSWKIHDLLQRLRVMGFIIANSKFYYAEPTPEMVQTMYTIELAMPLNRQKHLNKEKNQ